MRYLKGPCQAILYHVYITCTKAMIIENSYISWGWEVDFPCGFRRNSSNREMGLNFPWAGSTVDIDTLKFWIKLNKVLKKINLSMISVSYELCSDYQ